MRTSLTVGGGTQLSLTGCTLDVSVSLTMSSGGSLSLASMAVPGAVLGVVEAQLSGAGSTLRLSAVTLPEQPEVGELKGTMTVEADGSKTIDPPAFGQTVPFLVLSGPCTVSDGGRCVGRPRGYLGSEACDITVGGGGGVLGDCCVFDICPGPDQITLPDGSTHGGSDCPVGTVLTPGASVGWTSSSDSQGIVGNAARLARQRLRRQGRVRLAVELPRPRRRLADLLRVTGSAGGRRVAAQA